MKRLGGLMLSPAIQRFAKMQPTKVIRSKCSVCLGDGRRAHLWQSRDKRWNIEYALCDCEHAEYWMRKESSGYRPYFEVGERFYKHHKRVPEWMSCDEAWFLWVARNGYRTRNPRCRYFPRLPILDRLLLRYPDDEALREWVDFSEYADLKKARVLPSPAPESTPEVEAGHLPGKGDAYEGGEGGTVDERPGSGEFEF